MEWTDPRYRRTAETLRQAQAEADRRSRQAQTPQVTVRGFTYPGPAAKPTT